MKILFKPLIISILLISFIQFPLKAEESNHYWEYRLAPDGASLIQFISYPVGLGYFSQGELDRGLTYASFQLGSLVLGSILGPEKGGSSPTQLLAPINVGIWLISIADVNFRAQQRNHTPLKGLWIPGQTKYSTITPSIPTSIWKIGVISPFIFQSRTSFPFTVAPGLSLNQEYPVGKWLSRYYPPLKELQLTLNSQFFFPVYSISEQNDFAGIVKNSGGLKVDLGLVQKHHLDNWNYYYGGRMGRLFRSSVQSTGQGIAFPSVTYQGVSLIGGLTFKASKSLNLDLSLETGYYFSIGQSDQGSIPAIILLTPEFNMEWNF